jgi:hypothetical protein
VRIDTVRAGSIAARGGRGGSSSGVAFHVGEGGAAQRATATAPALGASSVDSLLALQAAADPTQGRRKTLRRGRSLLDTLDAIKTDLLLGRISEGRLNQLMAIVGQARDRTEPGLDALLDDIELRARVELAKRGLFPAL